MNLGLTSHKGHTETESWFKVQKTDEVGKTELESYW